MLGDIGRRAAILASKRKALHHAQSDQNGRRGDAPAIVARQQSDEKGTDAHQGHRGEERILSSDQVAKMTKNQGAEWAHHEAGREGEQRKDESNIRRHVGEEVFGEKRAKRSVNEKIVPLKGGAKRGGENHLPFLGSHALGADTACRYVSYCHPCSPSLKLFFHACQIVRRKAAVRIVGAAR